MQIEVLLFFMIIGPGALFLAGDPSQSVIEGADFQFKDIRTVASHFIGDSRRDLLPNKPKKVSLNFRTHSRIIHLAAAVIKCLSRSFPNSIDKMITDKALFQGPRPSLLYNIKVDNLYELSKKVEGVVFLTHDENVLKSSL